MRIGGFVKQSLIDWEGVLSAVVFTKGCNFRCDYCHNPSLVLPSLTDHLPHLSETAIFDYLRRRREWIEGVVVTGGEPTLHPGLTGFLERVKRLGYRIKLDTNGTNTELLSALIDMGLVDCVAMDIKTIPDREHYAKIYPAVTDRQMDNVQRSIDLLRKSGIDSRFRTPLIPGPRRRRPGRPFGPIRRRPARFPAIPPYGRHPVGLPAGTVTFRTMHAAPRQSGFLTGAGRRIFRKRLY